MIKAGMISQVKQSNSSSHNSRPMVLSGRAVTQACRRRRRTMSTMISFSTSMMTWLSSLTLKTTSRAAMLTLVQCFQVVLVLVAKVARRKCHLVVKVHGLWHNNKRNPYHLPSQKQHLLKSLLQLHYRRCQNLSHQVRPQGLTPMMERSMISVSCLVYINNNCLRSST